jgi:hypothetical protein
MGLDSNRIEFEVKVPRRQGRTVRMLVRVLPLPKGQMSYPLAGEGKRGPAPFVLQAGSGWQYVQGSGQCGGLYVLDLALGHRAIKARWELEQYRNGKVRINQPPLQGSKRVLHPKTWSPLIFQ